MHQNFDTLKAESVLAALRHDEAKRPRAVLCPAVRTEKNQSCMKRRYHAMDSMYYGTAVNVLRRAVVYTSVAERTHGSAIIAAKEERF